MFGDSYFCMDAHLTFATSTNLKTVSVAQFGPRTIDSDAALPLASADRVAKFAENGNTVPGDRVYFLYNHFNGALDGQADQVGENLVPIHLQRNFDVDRYTLGVEKTLFSPSWSVELRLPFFGVPDVDTPIQGCSGGNVGNLAVIVKRLLYRSEGMAASAGLGIDTPTGHNLDAAVGPADLTIYNDAVHVMPFLALLGNPTDRAFFQAFLQVDVPANGDRVHDVDSLTRENGMIGSYQEQTLLYVRLGDGLLAVSQSVRRRPDGACRDLGVPLHRHASEHALPCRADPDRSI